MPIQAYLETGVALLVLAAAGRDLLDQRIPNAWLAAGLACAALLQLLGGGPRALLLQGAGGLLVGLALLLPFYVRRGMAAGDVKLMAVVGAFTGPRLACYACLASCLAGGLLALALAWSRGSRAGDMPYAPAIAAGTLVTLILFGP